MNKFVSKLKKINLAIVKEYLLKHGEKVALGTCVFIALLLGMLGLLRAMSAGRDASGRPWAQEIITHKERIDRDIGSAQTEPLKPGQEAMLVKGRYVWDRIDLPHTPMPFLHTTDKRGQDKRMNPPVLSIRHKDDDKKKDVKKKDDKKYFQLDYIRACMLLYQNDQESRFELEFAGAAAVPRPDPQPGVAGPMPMLAKRAEPARMVAGYALFPMKEQVEEFRKALRMSSQKELVGQQADLPRVIGFTLKRYEIGSNGKPVNPEGEILIGYDKDGKPKMAASVRRMLREAVYDDRGPVYLEPYLHAGLTMPLPRLGNAHYPRPYLEGVEIKRWYEDDDKRGGIAVAPPPKKVGGGGKLPGVRPIPMPLPPEGGDPRMAGPEGTKKEISQKELKALHAPLAGRLFTKEKELETQINVYHALGRFTPEEESKKFPGWKPQDGPRFFSAWKFWPVAKPEEAVFQPEIKPDPQGKPEEPVDRFPKWDKDALVRFIDPEVEPGKKYEYGIQIRMASPNFGKKDLVAFDKIALDAELPPGIEVRTHQISIPYEYHLYAVDQQLLDKWAANEELKKVLPKDTTTFQIHKWVKNEVDLVRSKTQVIGDWAVAERIIVRRGDPIGVKAAVAVPVWKELRDAFEVPRLVDDPEPKDKKNVGKVPGININLNDTAIKPDGTEINLPPPVLVDFAGGKRFKPNGVFEEETAVDALIMMPDGKLKVLNSRLDSEPLSDDGHERHERVMLSRRRASVFMGADPTRKVPVPGAK